MPVGAAQAQGNDNTNQIIFSKPLSEEMVDLINLHGAEIEIVEGSPVIVVGGLDEEIYIPFGLPATMDVLIHDKPVTVEVDGNYLLIPLEGEIEKTCISDFDVKEIRDGQIILEGEVNPRLKLALKVGVAVIGTIGSVIAIGSWLYGMATSNDQDSVKVRNWLTNKRPVYTPDIDVFVPATGITGAEVAAEVRDLDHGKRVRVYLIGERTGEKLRIRGELPITGDRIRGATMLDVQRRHVDEVYELLRKNNGRITIKLEKVSVGSVWIEGIAFGVDW